MVDWERLEAALARRLDGERLAHVRRVQATARDLSRQHGAPVEAAEVAGLMHDYARCMPAAALLAEARRRNLVVDPSEEVQPYLLHGPVAAALLAEEGLVTDPATLDAIRWHTTGRPGMGLLEKVIWLADYIEPGRSFPGVEEIRAVAMQDLDRALLMAFDNTLSYLVQRGLLIHLYTVQARNWLLRAQRKLG
ncbi:MAG TPA: bis(5'-nucleosyl)-tetraphosphatase (symmetrical) YqeK [Symbiobacteriaceae bacterium]